MQESNDIYYEYLKSIGSLSSYLIESNLSNEEIMSILLDYKVSFEDLNSKHDYFTIEDILCLVLHLESSFKRNVALSNWISLFNTERRIDD